MENAECLGVLNLSLPSHNTSTSSAEAICEILKSPEISECGSTILSVEGVKNDAPQESSSPDGGDGTLRAGVSSLPQLLEKDGKDLHKGNGSFSPNRESKDDDDNTMEQEGNSKRRKGHLPGQSIFSPDRHCLSPEVIVAKASTTPIAVSPPPKEIVESVANSTNNRYGEVDMIGCEKGQEEEGTRLNLSRDCSNSSHSPAVRRRVEFLPDPEDSRLANNSSCDDAVPPPAAAAADDGDDDDDDDDDNNAEKWKKTECVLLIDRSCNEGPQDAHFLYDSTDNETLFIIGEDGKKEKIAGAVIASASLPLKSPSTKDSDVSLKSPLEDNKHRRVEEEDKKKEVEGEQEVVPGYVFDKEPLSSKGVLLPVVENSNKESMHRSRSSNVAGHLLVEQQGRLSSTADAVVSSSSPDSKERPIAATTNTDPIDNLGSSFVAAIASRQQLLIKSSLPTPAAESNTTGSNEGPCAEEEEEEGGEKIVAGMWKGAYLNDRRFFTVTLGGRFGNVPPSNDRLWASIKTGGKHVLHHIWLHSFGYHWKVSRRSEDFKNLSNCLSELPSVKLLKNTLPSLPYEAIDDMSLHQRHMQLFGYLRKLLDIEVAIDSKVLREFLKLDGGEKRGGKLIASPMLRRVASISKFIVKHL
eukprot:jgi/Bigna1/128293/aug1.6_g3001